MTETNCIFCKIANGEIPSYKIREDENFVAVLDIFPNRKGMTLVLPKTHHDSDITNIEDDILQKGILAVKEVESLLKKTLKVNKVGLVIEGLEVAHLHFKLYPFYNDVSYPDGVENGPQATTEELQKVSDQIKNTNG